MKPVTLYHRPISHYCEKARRVLEYKRIPHTLAYTPYHDPSELLRLSGQDYVPYIDCGRGAGVTWPEIADWAERTVPVPTIYPTGRAVARIVEQWAHGLVEEAVWKVVVSEMPATFSDPREAWVFEEMQMRSRGPLDVMRARRPEFLAGLTSVLAFAEDALAEHPFLLGAQPSLADFALYGALRPLEAARIDVPTPRTRAWYATTATVTA